MKLLLIITICCFSSLFLAQSVSKEEYMEFTKILLNDTLTKSNEGIYQKPIVTRGESYSAELQYAIKSDTKEKYVGKYILFCKKSIWDKLNRAIENYVKNVSHNFNMDILVFSIDNETPMDIKNSIKKEKEQLKGITFIGDIATAWFELKNDFEYVYSDKYSQFPCDLFYMDLDGEWVDENNNGLYDKHSGHVKPEIFVSRIHPYLFENTNSIEALQGYFSKNENYYASNFGNLEYKSCAFVDKDWQSFKDHSMDINYVHGKNNSQNETPLKSGASFGKNLYYNTLQNKVGFLQFDCHSSETRHYLSTGEYVMSWEILQKPISSVGLNLFCCSALNWKGKRYGQPLLGASYLFGKNNVQCLVGSTKSGSMLNFDEFYKPLGVGKCMGDAFVDWWNSGVSETHDNFIISWHYGMAMFGDPMIRLGKQNFYIVNPDELLSIQTENNTTCADGSSYIELEVNKNINGELVWFDGTKNQTLEIKPNKTMDYKVYLFDDNGNGFLTSKTIEFKKSYKGSFPSIFYKRKNQKLEIDITSYNKSQKLDSSFYYSWSTGEVGPIITLNSKKDTPIDVTVYGGCSMKTFHAEVKVISSFRYFIREKIGRKKMVEYKFNWSR
jgi:hypothetical protein